MYPIKRLFQSLVNLPPSIFLRNILGTWPKYYKEPPSNCSVSDLLFWRFDDVWRTRFDLLNLPSVLYPKGNITDKVTLIFYDQQGQKLCQEKITILPFQKKIIQIEDFLSGNPGFGSLAVFHDALEEIQNGPMQTCIAERGFSSYQRVTDNSPLWSYIHGAAYLLAKPPDQDEVQSTRRSIGKNTFYKPQLSLSDCGKFDLIYINPNDSDLEIKVRALDQTSLVVEEASGVLPPRGVKIFSMDNQDRTILRVENESRAYMVRPYILKYHETHFDIFHG
jgi:hypothetical protein